MGKEVTFWVKFEHVKSIETSSKSNVKFTLEGDHDKLVKVVSQIDLESGYKVELEEGEYTLTLEMDELFYSENYIVDEKLDEVEIFIS